MLYVFETKYLQLEVCEVSEASCWIKLKETECQKLHLPLPIQFLRKCLFNVIVEKLYRNVKLPYCYGAHS